mmetsp:Transcript_33500/g.66416  ORF Transcript_33500/g.66416 Transcript_33500/m.66416 type:complete len:147 (+) Transcript_33500:1166-1606(+)
MIFGELKRLKEGPGTDTEDVLSADGPGWEGGAVSLFLFCVPEEDASSLPAAIPCREGDGATASNEAEGSGEVFPEEFKRSSAGTGLVWEGRSCLDSTPDKCLAGLLGAALPLAKRETDTASDGEIAFVPAPANDMDVFPDLSAFSI